MPVTSCVCAHGTGIYFQVCCWLNLQMSSAMSPSLGRGLGSWALGWAPAARQEVSWARAAGGGGPALNTSLGIKEANPVTMLFYYLVLLIPLGKKLGFCYLILNVSVLPMHPALHYWLLRRAVSCFKNLFYIYMAIQKYFRQRPVTEHDLLLINNQYFLYRQHTGN